MPATMPPAEHMLFHDLHRAHLNAINAALVSRGLQDVGQPKILLVLDALQGGGATQRELAEAIHVSSPTMAISLKSLARQGYVSRQSDERDGRCKRVAITPKGSAAVESCREAFNAVDAQIYQGFTPEEVEQLKNFYWRMLQNLYAIGGDRSPECAPEEPAVEEMTQGKED